MAWTEAERVAIRKYTGRPVAPRRDRFGTSSSGEIESAMDELEGNAAREAAIRVQLTALALIETEITGAHGFAVMEKAEELNLDPQRYAHLRTNGLRECQLLCQLLGIRLIGNPFGASGWSGGFLPMG